MTTRLTKEERFLEAIENNAIYVCLNICNVGISQSLFVPQGESRSHLGDLNRGPSSHLWNANRHTTSGLLEVKYQQVKIQSISMTLVAALKIGTVANDRDLQQLKATLREVSRSKGSQQLEGFIKAAIVALETAGVFTTLMPVDEIMANITDVGMDNKDSCQTEDRDIVVENNTGYTSTSL